MTLYTTLRAVRAKQGGETSSSTESFDDKYPSPYDLDPMKVNRPTKRPYRASDSDDYFSPRKRLTVISSSNGSSSFMITEPQQSTASSHDDAVEEPLDLSLKGQLNNEERLIPNTEALPLQWRYICHYCLVESPNMTVHEDHIVSPEHIEVVYSRNQQLLSKFVGIHKGSLTHLFDLGIEHRRLYVCHSCHLAAAINDPEHTNSSFHHDAESMMTRRCEACNETFSTIIKFEGHLATVRHLQNQIQWAVAAITKYCNPSEEQNIEHPATDGHSTRPAPEFQHSMRSELHGDNWSTVAEVAECSNQSEKQNIEHPEADVYSTRSASEFDDNSEILDSDIAENSSGTFTGIMNFELILPVKPGTEANADDEST